jgi:hypothetical protein
MVAVVLPLLQRKRVPPDAVRSTLAGVQKVVGPAGVITATVVGLAVTDWVAVEEQPAVLLTVTR